MRPSLSPTVFLVTHLKVPKSSTVTLWMRNFIVVRYPWCSSSTEYLDSAIEVPELFDGDADSGVTTGVPEGSIHVVMGRG